MQQYILNGFNLEIEKIAGTPIGVAAVCVVRDGKMLLGKRRDNKRWTQPGGHLEGNESPIIGAVRELEEETGIKAKPSELEHLTTELINKKSGKRLKIYAFLYHAKDTDSTTMKEDPDAEVFRWHYISKEKLFSDEIWNNMHVPPEDNCVFKALNIKRPMEKKAFPVDLLNQTLKMRIPKLVK